MKPLKMVIICALLLVSYVVPTDSAAARVASAPNKTGKTGRTGHSSRRASVAVVRLVELLEVSCGKCHNPESRVGGLDLKSLPVDLSAPGTRAQWVGIHDRIERREMPPDPASLTDAGRQRLLAGLRNWLLPTEQAEILVSGRGPMRRLNRDEYEQNLRDLLHLPDLDIRDMLPEDRESRHFNKVSETLDTSRVQLTAWLDAAETALRQAMATGARQAPLTLQKAVGDQLSVGRETTGGREAMFWIRDSKGIDLAAEKKAAPKGAPPDPTIEMALFRSPGWPYGIFPKGIVAPAAGNYRVRFAARAVLQQPGFHVIQAADSVPMTFRSRRPTNHDIAEDVRSTGGNIDIDPAGGTYETIVHLAAGQTIEYGLLGLPVPQPDVKGMTAEYRFPPFPAGGQPGIAFKWLEMEGPLPSASSPSSSPSWRVLFDDLTPDQMAREPEREARRLLRRFITNAARGPVPVEAIAGFERLVQRRLASGRPLTEALLTGYQAFLSSELFVYLPEPVGESDHYAIANRLSHLFTDSRPDNHLLALARQKQLRDATVLRRETERLIASDKFSRFVDHFTDSWLDLRNLRRDDPDIRFYPEYRLDDFLTESAGLETRAFFNAMVRENLPAVNVVTSDFTWVNERLARHYGLPHVSGAALRKVRLPAGSPYGGLLTQAAILKVSANGTSTSPVLRGVWVMDRLMGEPPPPPPPGVPAVEPDIRGARTIRELLALHTRSASCAACHARFDSVGLALENFDVLGGWRTRYRGLENGERVSGIDRTGHDFSYTLAGTVDASGRLPDGRRFNDINELKKLLAANPRQLARNLLHQFTLYATGTPVRFSDRDEIEAILDACAKDQYRLRDLLIALTQSRIFLGPKGCR
jgi:hypothetical protein